MKNIDKIEDKSREAASMGAREAKKASRSSYEAPAIISTNAPIGAEKAKLANACTSLNSITPDWEG